MSINQNTSVNQQEAKLPSADTGNARNPSPHNDKTEPAGNNQLLDKKAETYLRESANIEDMPDPQEEQEAEDTMRNKDQDQ